MELADLLSFSDDYKYAYLSISKVDSPFGKDDLLYLLDESKMQGTLIHEALFPDLLKKIKAETEYLSEKERPEKVLIAERRDYQFEIVISEDALSVTLNFTQAYGGALITLEPIMEALDAKRVKYGIKNIVLKAFLEQSTRVDPGATQSVLIASGLPSVDGEDAYFEYLVKTGDEVFTPKVDESGKVDMRNSYNMLTVLEGESLIRLHPATPGKDGINVYNEPVQPTPGMSLSFKLYDGSRLNKDDPNLLEAEIGGQPKVFRDGASVSNVLNLKKIDLHSGNIDFDGSIIVMGDIAPKMSVVVTGDLEVRGLIEDANIKVKGDLIVGKGIIGKKNPEMEDLSCTIKAGGTIHSTFAQYAHIESSHDITMTSYVSNCEVITNGKLIVTNSNHTAGTIMGGSICADRGIETTHIGTSADIITNCEIFFYYTELYRKITSELKRQEELKNALYKLFLIKKKLKSVALKVNQQRKDAELAVIAHNEAHYNKQIVKSKELSDRLTVRLKKDENAVDLKVYGHLYPGCRLSIGAHRVSVKSEEIAIRYRLIDGKLITEAI